MSTATETSPQATASAEKFTGRVKWFNNNAGYGFITITDGVKSGEDIFVHHTAIVVQSEQYKYLVQGEYVSLSLATTTNATHETQAVGVSGINGGKLMCETRRENKSERGEQLAPAPASAPASAKAQRSARPKSTVVAPKSAPVPVADEGAQADWKPARKPRTNGVGVGGRGGRGGAGRGQK